MAEANICTICRSSLHDGRDFITTSCQHMFHTECIATNANISNNKCPNCRAPIPSFRNVFTGYESIKKNPKENIISDEDDENGWTCPACTFLNSSTINICEVCGQGMRVQAENLKPSDDIKKPVRKEPEINLSCNTRHCNMLDPSSNILCDKCISAIWEAPSSPAMPYNPQRTVQNKSLVPPHPSPNTTDSIPMEIDPINSYEKEWCCEYCDYPNNLNSNERCVYCQQGHRPREITSSSTNISNIPQVIDQQTKQDSATSYQTLTEKSPYVSFDGEPEQRPSIKPAAPRVPPVIQTVLPYNENSLPAIVYIPDLPVGKPGTELEQTIRTRLKEAHRIKVSRVQCLPNLGVAIVHLAKQEDKDYLVNNLQCVVLFPNNGIKVTFIEKLEVISYIVLDKNEAVPSIDTIARRWIELFPSNDRPQFEILSIQFPNIIKVTSFSIEELQAAAKFRVFQVEDQIALIYTHVDCSYLEELPRSQPKRDENRTFCFIATQLHMSDRARTDKALCQEQANNLFQEIKSLPSSIRELKSQLYIQYDEQSSNAILLVSNALHHWALMKFICIDGQLIFKTANMSSKLIIKPIDLDFPLRLIFDHPIFKKSIKEDISKLIGEHLVVEINDKNIYDKCLKIGAFEVVNNGDTLTLRILPYTTLEDPDNSEINVENWYGARMQNHKPDITLFDSRHPIFRYKWNSKIWLDQFLRNKKELEQIVGQGDRRLNDFIRRMLRITVMLNTIATMRKRKYILEDSKTKTEVLIEPPSSLITILYNHQSKVIQSSQTFTPPFSSTNVRVLTLSGPPY